MRRRLLLSGTPVQNNTAELLSLLSFLMPRVFPRAFYEAILDTASSNNNTINSSSSSSSSGSGISGLSLSQLRSMLAPFVLRRLKADVLSQLVGKAVVVVPLQGLARQSGLYEQTLRAAACRRAGIAADADAGAGAGAGAGGAAMVVAQPDEDEDEDEEPKPKPQAQAQAQAQTNGNGQNGSKAPTTTETKAQAQPEAEAETEKEAEPEAEAELDSAPDLGLPASEARHLFTDLRKAANHPLLLRSFYSDQAVLQKIASACLQNQHFGAQASREQVAAELLTLSDYELNQICSAYPSLAQHTLDDECLYDSAKICYRREALPRLVAQGHHVLVFTQWVKLLDLLEILVREFLSIECLRLDGSTPVGERQGLVDEFNTGTFPVFLLSTKAGGLGINLTKADTVIFHDLDFNPEADRQAEDRAHRIGQTRPVTVYKLYVTETVDQDIFEMGERKSALSSAVLRGAGAGGHEGGETPHGRAGRGAGAGTGGGVGDASPWAGDGKGDVGAIGKILSKAMSRLAPAAKK